MLFSTAVSICVLFSCTNKKNTGPESAVIRTHYSIIDGNQIKRSEAHYNEHGQLILEVFLNSKGDTNRQIVYTYIDTLLVQTDTYVNGVQVLSSKYRYVGSRMIECLNMDSNIAISKTYYDWFPTGQKQREVTEYYYDKHMPITTVTNYNQSGQTESVYRQIYDDSTRRVIRRYEMDSYRTLTDTATGKPLRELVLIHFGFHEPADTLLDTRYQYDEEKNLQKAIFSYKNAPDQPDSTFWSYRSDGLPSIQINWYSTGSTRGNIVSPDTLLFEYDAMKRLISEHSSQSGSTQKYIFTENIKH